jgi:putative transposase
MNLAPQSIRTFFVTFSTAGRRSLFQSEQFATLLLSVLANNRQKHRFQLHEFVIMPDHVHLLITPAPEVSLEKAVQFIKGGFSFRAKRDLGSAMEIWHTRFNEHRIQDTEDYSRNRGYIRRNPLKAGLGDQYEYLSGNRSVELDPAPEWVSRWETRG